ncbi:MAG: hypothetical protein K6G15_06440 [Desulfovibrio sp.]|nr:hypothetical protein [Desulfovibrio sp.]
MSSQAFAASQDLLPITQASFPEPFAQSLEFNAPVRGPWNIVHMALQIPEAHLLYICARGCLRGVIMTAAEMGAMARLSWIGLTEEELTCGLLDDRCFEAICHIVEKLSPRPPLILLYLSCVHKFVQMDYPALLARLNERFPGLRFLDCHMMPTMRKSGPTDEERTKSKMYEAIERPAKQEERAITLVGNDWPLCEQSQLFQMLHGAGYTLRELARCRSYADYQKLGTSRLLLTTHADALFAAQNLSTRLEREHIHLPASFSLTEIQSNLTTLSQILGIPLPDLSAQKAAALNELCALQNSLGKRPITIDYTLSMRPLSLARLLIEQNFCVTHVFLDAIAAPEEDDFRWLQQHAKDLLLVYTRAPAWRFAEQRATCLKPQGDEVLALGQKAAFFSGTNHFVNCVAGGGLYDYAAITTLVRLMREALEKPKDRRRVIQYKGLGLPSCLSGQLCHPRLAKTKAAKNAATHASVSTTKGFA